MGQHTVGAPDLQRAKGCADCRDDGPGKGRQRFIAPCGEVGGVRAGKHGCALGGMIEESQASVRLVSRANRPAHSFHSHNVSAMKAPVPAIAPVFLR